MNCAPAAIFLASRSGRKSCGGANGFSAAPRNTCGGPVILRPERNRPSSRIMRIVSQQRQRVEVEHRLGFRMVARLHAVAGQAQDVGDAERRGAEHVALDRDPVVVAAGDLHVTGE